MHSYCGGLYMYDEKQVSKICTQIREMGSPETKQIRSCFFIA